MNARLAIVGCVAAVAPLALAACSSSAKSAPASNSRGASSTTAGGYTAVVPAAHKLLADDHAPPSQLAAYQQALTALGKHCQDGVGVSFSVDTMAATSSHTRLEVMQAVTKAIGARTNVDCVAAILDYTSGTPITVDTSPEAPAPSTTKAISVGANGTCNPAEASWAPLLGQSKGIAITTLDTGPLTAMVDLRGMPSADKHVTVGLLDTPYSIEISGVDRSKIVRVQLISPAEDGQLASSCIVTEAK